MIALRSLLLRYTWMFPRGELVATVFTLPSLSGDCAAVAASPLHLDVSKGGVSRHGLYTSVTFGWLRCGRCLFATAVMPQYWLLGSEVGLRVVCCVSPRREQALCPLTTTWLGPCVPSLYQALPEDVCVVLAVTRDGYGQGIASH